MNSLRNAIRLARPFWVSTDRKMAIALLVVVLFLNVALVAIAVLLTYWQRAFFNALEVKDWNGFLGLLFTWDTTPEGLMLGFGPILAVFVVCTVYALYLKQALQIRWRAWMTDNHVSGWLGEKRYYLNSLDIGATDNIDQRLSEDIDLFVEGALSLGLGLVTAILSLISFIILLWTLSEPITVLGVTVYGYLVWLAILYAGLGTVVTHLLGRRLIRLNFDRQRKEADFRYGLIQVRDNAESIALHSGEESERQYLSDAFKRVVFNWHGIMTITKRVTFFQSTYNQAALVFPLAISAPAYFAGRIPLGGIFQTAGAFVKVQESLSWVVDNYAAIAQWLSAVERLNGYMAGQTQASEHQSGFSQSAGRALLGTEMKLNLPNGRPLMDVGDISVNRGARILIEGPSGAGKSTLLRALAGLWPFGSGSVVRPTGRCLMFPQHAYVPNGSLRRALAYPLEGSGVSDDACAHALELVGLSSLQSELDTVDAWRSRLSGGEVQRLALARAVIYQPDWLFLDEATANLDVDWEEKFYKILASELPNTTIVSVSHRLAARSHHGTVLTVSDGKLKKTAPFK